MLDRFLMPGALSGPQWKILFNSLLHNSSLAHKKMEAATCRLPKLKHRFQQLEVKSQRHLNDARVAAQDLVRMQEVARQW